MGVVETRLPGRARRIVLSAVVAHGPLIVILGAFGLAYVTLLNGSHRSVKIGIVPMIAGLAPLAGIFVGGCIVLGLLALLFTRKRKETVKRAMSWLASRNWIEILLLRLPLALMFVSGVNYFHLAFKINIASFVPFSWDHFFAWVDRLIFAGYDPWTLSHALMPGTLATQVFDTLYRLWFLVMEMSIFAVAVLPARHPLRLTFLTAFGLNWMIGGVLVAILFSSAGPVYMQALTGDPTFAPLMERLHAQSELVKIDALEAQKWLWDGYTLPDVDFYGISAFPSMHLAISATCACLGFNFSRLLGWLLSAFTLGIMLGSVHLGWHYAIDGIFGILMALVLWRISNRIAAWWLALTARGPKAPFQGPTIAAPLRASAR